MTTGIGTRTTEETARQLDRQIMNGNIASTWSKTS
jgi:hypothetical protein